MELIDRQALRAAHGLGADCDNCKQNARSCQYDRDFSRMDFCEWLDDAPTIDAVEVRHGEWLHSVAVQGTTSGGVTYYHGYTCSVCGGLMGRKGDAYCYNCGARMDGERREG